MCFDTGTFLDVTENGFCIPPTCWPSEEESWGCCTKEGGPRCTGNPDNPTSCFTVMPPYGASEPPKHHPTLSKSFYTFKSEYKVIHIHSTKSANNILKNHYIQSQT